MMRGKFRGINTYSVEEVDSKTSYCEESDVISMVDEIEDRIKDMRDLLDGIKGIDIIDDVKNSLEVLSEDLH